MKKALWLILFLFICSAAEAQNVPQKRPDREKSCFDFTNTLPDDLVREINAEGGGIKRSFDVDFVLAIVPDLQGEEIEDAAVKMFSNWEIGKATKGKKGLMILLAKKEQKIKIEVGYDLEGVYTDAFVGQVERDILKEFLELADWEKGFLATIEFFLGRIYKLRDQGEDVKDVAPTGDLSYYSQGAGAKTTFNFGAALNRPLPDNYEEIKQYFSAQTTPELAFQRYMELCAKAVRHNNDLTLFTDLSNKFWQNWSHTSGQMRSEAQDIDGYEYFVRQKDNHAVVFIRDPGGDTKKLTLYFLFRSDKGWQVDINTMTRSLRYVGPNWLAMAALFHPYTEIIMEEYNLVTGFFTRWDDPRGLIPFHALGPGLYDENIPGYHIGVWDNYKSISNLRTRDIVESVNGENIRDWKHFFSFFNDAPAGSSYKITLRRGGKRMTVTETLSRYPDGFEDFRKYLKTPRMWMGVYMSQATDPEWRQTIQMRNAGKFRYSSLCSILEVAPGSPADQAGLKPMDLIVDYGKDDNNGEIMSYDIMKGLAATKPGESIKFTVVRDLKDILKITVTPQETENKKFF